jgi:uncharacterized membrane protein HdeD (DUF308 family)
MSETIPRAGGDVPAAAPHTGVRIAIGILGAAAVVVGVVLLFNPVSAARTLALLFALALVVGGLLEIAAGWNSGHRGGAIFLGAVLINGAARIALAVGERDRDPHWGWTALAGAVNLLVGVLVLVWPEATVVVLSLILGLQIIMFGLLLVVAAFASPGRLQPDVFGRRPATP